jgi:hypothetical protein
MAKYSIDSERSEVFVEARSNVHPIEIRTQGVRGFIEIELRGGEIDLSSAPRAELEISSDLLRSGIDLTTANPPPDRVRKYRTIKGSSATRARSVRALSAARDPVATA